MKRSRRWSAFAAAGAVVSLATACSLFVSLDDLQSVPPDAATGDASADGGSADGNGCPTGFATCGATCATDIANDPKNCGGCGVVCGSENTTAAPTCNGGKCIFSCAPHFDDCDGNGSNGCETALSAGNARQCGACTRDCLEGECADYECTSVSIVTDPAGNNIVGVAADGAHLYWTSAPADPGSDGGCTVTGGGVFSSNPDGGSITTVTTAFQPSSITLDDAGIYFMSDSCGAPKQSVLRIGKDGACSGASPCPRSLATNLDYFTEGLEVDDFHAYWLDVTYNAVHTVPLDGTVADNVIADKFKAIYGRTLAVDPSGPIWATPTYYAGDGGAAILSLPPGGGGSSGLVQLLEGTGYPGGVATDGTSIFWTTSDGFVFSASRTGGPQTMLASGQPGPTAIEVDATSVYWLVLGTGSGGAVMRIGKDGSCRRAASSCPEMLAKAGTPADLVLDPNAVYWTDHTIIHKVAK